MLFTFAIVLFTIAITAAIIQRTSASLSGHSKDLHGIGLGTSRAGILPYSPNTLDTFDLVTIVVDLLSKYWPGKAPKLQPKGDGFSLPRLHLGGVLRLTRKDYDHFQKALPKSAHEVVAPGGATNPLFLVSLTTPLLLVTLSHPECPIKPLGAVNTRNKFTLANPALCRDATALIAASKESALTFTASMGGDDQPGRRKRRGVEFEINIEVMHKGDLVMRQEMSFMQFLSKSVKPAYKGGDEVRQDTQLSARGPSVRVPGDGPKRYASCSKDYNPIHTSSLAAKLFGFPSAIAHGNHVLILTAQALIPGGDGATGSAEEKSAQSLLWVGQGPMSLEATFVKPVTPLPSDLSMGLGQVTGGATGEIGFGLSKKDKLCVSGSIKPT